MKLWSMDKTDWPDGPWKDEPDYVSWVDKDTMYRCVLQRNVVGAWQGRVGISADHPLFMIPYTNPIYQHIDVHGDIMYTSFIAADDQYFSPPQRSWWIGFDTMREDDYTPGYKPKQKNLKLIPEYAATIVYRDIAYVTDEIQFLAVQLFQYQKHPNPIL
jgi:hypothetical protein